MYAYCDQDDVEEYLGVALTANGVAMFNLLQPTLQDLVDNYCNRTWNVTNPIVENFDALQIGGSGIKGNMTFFPAVPPISKVVNDSNYPLAGGIISVKVGGAPIDMHYVVNYGTHLKITASFPSVIMQNPLGMKMIEVTYNSDAAGAVPNPVKIALIEWIARKIQTAPDAGKEVTRVQTGTVQAYYKQDDKGGIPDFVKMALDPYRVPALDHF